MIIFPSPAGELFTQASARALATEAHLIFGCGRYEGIDERVFSHAATLGRVRLISLGDYVLNGGEVAVMAMIEAIGRLIPGVVGNPESLVEESHEDGLLEYPSLHEARLVARAGGAARAAQRQPRRDRQRGGASSRSSGRASAARTCCPANSHRTPLGASPQFRFAHPR